MVTEENENLRAIQSNLVTHLSMYHLPYSACRSTRTCRLSNNSLRRKKNSGSESSS